jgi:hypothetical protein
VAIDDTLLRIARRAGERAADAQRAADLAKADYHHAIRRLQLAGATMREIAIALDLSHQRVQQIVDANGGGRRWRRRRPSDSETLRCSFCSAEKRKAKKLVSGPGVYICERCIAAAQLLSTGDPRKVDSVRPLERVDSPGARCGFCGTARRDAQSLVVASGEDVAASRPGKYGAASICNQCLDLCADIIEHQHGM